MSQGYRYNEGEELNFMGPRMAAKSGRRWRTQAIFPRPFHTPHPPAMAAFHGEQGWLQPLQPPLVLPFRCVQQKDLSLPAFMVGCGCAKRRERGGVLERDKESCDLGGKRENGKMWLRCDETSIVGGVARKNGGMANASIREDKRGMGDFFFPMIGHNGYQICIFFF